MSIAHQMLKSAFTMVLPKSWLLVRGPTNASNSGPPEIALTFDDGPHPEHTPRLLDRLAAARARGTFFVIGEKAQQHPNLIRRIVTAGHELGNHTFTHGEPSQTSAAHFLDETARTRRLLQDLTGRDCRLMRPPKGKLSVGKVIGLWRQQQTIVLWNVDSKDFSMPHSHEMHDWLDRFQPRFGDIVLLHDNHPHAAVCVERLTAETDTRPRFVTVSQWLGYLPLEI